MGLLDALGEIAGMMLSGQTPENCASCVWSTTEKVWNQSMSRFDHKWRCRKDKHAPCSYGYLCRHYQRRS